MNEIEFAEKLKADGYTEIETQNLEPRPAKGEHGHPFAIRGLVLAGTFIVTQDNQRTVYKPGQVFAVAQGHPHDESIGPEGARVLVGRKFANA
jgi:quercetin dioxygenase-like cupin family protein